MIKINRQMIRIAEEKEEQQEFHANNRFKKINLTIKTFRVVRFSPRNQKGIL